METTSNSRRDDFEPVYDPEDHRRAVALEFVVQAIIDHAGEAARKTAFAEAAPFLRTALSQLHHRPAGSSLSYDQALDIRAIWLVMTRRGRLWSDRPKTWAGDTKAVECQIRQWAGDDDAAMSVAEAAYRAKRLWAHALAGDCCEALEYIKANRLAAARATAIASGVAIDFVQRRALREAAAK